jgi:hypothetical protein
VPAIHGCGDNSRGSLLRPTGVTTVTLRGRIDFGDGSHPQSIVLAARRQPGFVSANTIVRVVGTLTDPQWTIEISPRLTQMTPGIWIDTLRVPAGEMQWKFVTNDNWESPYDYASADGSRPDGLENDLGYSTNGSSPVVKASVSGAIAGQLLVCEVDETRSIPHYRITPIGEGPAAYSSTIDGGFVLPGLVPGDYVLEVRTPGQPPRRVNVVVGDQDTDAGIVSVGTSGATGAIHGTVVWDPAVFPEANAPYPPTTVQLYDGATFIGQVATGGATNTFEFGPLAPGSYRLVADAHLFATTSTDTIAVTTFARSETVTLPVDLSELPNQMDLAGDFYGGGWPSGPDAFQLQDSTRMDLSALGVWVYPNSNYPAITISAGLHYFKFVTDGSYDNPTDFGGDESVTLTAPLADATTRLVGGTGTAFKVNFPTAGQYRFVLDERRFTFHIQPIGSPALRADAQRRRR